MDIEKLNEALAAWQEGPKLDESDYHNSTGFLSNSFIGDFLSCEYGAILGYGIKENQPFNSVFAIGHLVEAEIFEGKEGRNKMLERYGDNALKKDGKPYKWTEDSRELAQSVTKHNKLKDLFRSEGSIYHQIITFDLHGFKWRGEIDYLNLNKNTEIDLKTTKDFNDKSWNEETRQKDMTFIDNWNYHRQRALYQVGIKSNFDQMVQPRILAVSKKNKSVRMFKFDDQDRLDYEISSLLPITDRIKTVINGEDKPQQCEVCDHCVASETVDTEILTSEYCANWS